MSFASRIALSSQGSQSHYGVALNRCSKLLQRSLFGCRGEGLFDLHPLCSSPDRCGEDIYDHDFRLCPNPHYIIVGYP